MSFSERQEDNKTSLKFNCIPMIILGDLILSWYIGQFFGLASEKQPLGVVLGILLFVLVTMIHIQFYKIYVTERKRYPSLAADKIFLYEFKTAENYLSDESKNLYPIDKLQNQHPFVQSQFQFSKRFTHTTPASLAEPDYRTLPGDSPLISLLNTKLILAWFEKIDFIISIRCDLQGLSYIPEPHLSDLLDNLCSHLFHEARFHHHPRVTLEITQKEGAYAFVFYSNAPMRHTKLRRSGQYLLSEHPALRSSGLYGLKHILELYQGSFNFSYMHTTRMLIMLPERKNVTPLFAPSSKNFKKNIKKTKPNQPGKNKSNR